MPENESRGADAWRCLRWMCALLDERLAGNRRVDVSGAASTAQGVGRAAAAVSAIFQSRGYPALQVIWRAPMRGLSVAAAVCLTLLLAGCGGSDETIVRDELPVSCVTGSGSSRCPPGRGRFYYDYQSDRCLPTGAGRCGARMLFDTLDDCTSYCGAAR